MVLPRPLIRLLRWEFWPMPVIYLPVAAYYLWLSLKTRSFAFFTASNPAVPLGGFTDDPKSAFHSLFPAHLQPKMVFSGPYPGQEKLTDAIQAAGAEIPLFAKPDLGERGFLARKIESVQGLEDLGKYPGIHWLVQVYVAYPLEMSVLYYKFPGSARGGITSLTEKVLLSLTGDGHATLAQLAAQDYRVWLHWPRISKKRPDRAQYVPAAGERVLLEPVGNHVCGAMFLNRNDWISPALTAVFDRLTAGITGICMGRFDLKCASFEQLEAGQDFLILEWNGAKSEPIRIYDHAYPLWKAWRDLFRHWRLLYEVSVANIKLGHQPAPFGFLLARMRAHIRYKRPYLRQANT